MKQVLSKLFAGISLFLAVFSFVSCNFNFDSNPQSSGNSIVVNLGANVREVYTKEDAGLYTLSLYSADAVYFAEDSKVGFKPVLSGAPYKSVETSGESVEINGIAEGDYFLYAEVWTDSSKKIKIATGYSLSGFYEPPENADVMKNFAIFNVSNISQTHVRVSINDIFEKGGGNVIIETEIPSVFNSSNLEKISDYINSKLSEGAPEITLKFEGELSVDGINSALPYGVENAYCIFDLSEATLIPSNDNLSVAFFYESPFEIIYSDSVVDGTDLLYYGNKEPSQANSNLKKVTALGCTTLDAGAFRNCTSLESVNIPNVTDIPEYAFSGCNSLSEINLSNVKTIGKSAFSMEGSGGNLTSINLSSCTSIGANAFQYCCSENMLTVTDDNNSKKWNTTIDLTTSSNAEVLRQGNSSAYTRTL